MSFDVRFTNEINPSLAGEIGDALLAPRLFIDTAEDYGEARHRQWVEKTVAELESGDRHALAAVIGGKAIGGVLIFRDEPDNPSIINIRNLTIGASFRNRAFGTLMVDNIFHVAHEIYPDIKEAVVDTKANNGGMINFFIKRGFTVSRVDDLYESGKPDVILARPLPPLDEVA